MPRSKLQSACKLYCILVLLRANECKSSPEEKGDAFRHRSYTVDGFSNPQIRVIIDNAEHGPLTLNT